jgi:hypothetical protein
MIGDDCPNIFRVKKDWIYLADGPFLLLETKCDPNAVLILDGFNSALVIEHYTDQPPIDWLVTVNCADHALVTKQEGQIICYIIEQKSSLNARKWSQAKKQFQGMLYNVSAALHIIGAPKIDVCKAVITFTSLNLGFEPSSTDPILNKVLLGSSDPIVNFSDFLLGAIDLDEFGRCEVIKVERSPETGIGCCLV